MTKITTGCREPGYWRRSLVSCGLQHIGAGAAVRLYFTKVIGGRGSDSMAGSTTATDTRAAVTKAGAGKVIGFTTTGP